MQKTIIRDLTDSPPVECRKIGADCVNSTDGNLELNFLPPYLPQLDPDEQVWQNVKERVAKQAPTNKYQLRIREALEYLQKLPFIVAAIFRHPEFGFVN